MESINVAQKIRELRIEREWSQAAVGAALGISQNAYSKIERGYSQLTVDRLFKLADMFEVDICKLLKN